MHNEPVAFAFGILGPCDEDNRFYLEKHQKNLRVVQLDRTRFG